MSIGDNRSMLQSYVVKKGLRISSPSSRYKITIEDLMKAFKSGSSGVVYKKLGKEFNIKVIWNIDVEVCKCVEELLGKLFKGDRFSESVKDDIMYMFTVGEICEGVNKLKVLEGKYGNMEKRNKMKGMYEHMKENFL